MTPNKTCHQQGFVKTCPDSSGSGAERLPRLSDGQGLDIFGLMKIRSSIEVHRLKSATNAKLPNR